MKTEDSTHGTVIHLQATYFSNGSLISKNESAPFECLKVCTRNRELHNY